MKAQKRMAAQSSCRDISVTTILLPLLLLLLLLLPTTYSLVSTTYYPLPTIPENSTRKLPVCSTQPRSSSTTTQNVSDILVVHIIQIVSNTCCTCSPGNCTCFVFPPQHSMWPVSRVSQGATSQSIFSLVSLVTTTSY
jgi:hypothetical protein